MGKLKNHTFNTGQVIQIYHKVPFYGSTTEQFVVLGILDTDLYLVKLIEGVPELRLGKYSLTSSPIDNPNISLTSEVFDIDLTKMPVSF